MPLNTKRNLKKCEKGAARQKSARRKTAQSGNRLPFGGFCATIIFEVMADGDPGFTVFFDGGAGGEHHARGGCSAHHAAHAEPPDRTDGGGAGRPAF